jgi:hypothetical protein
LITAAMLVLLVFLANRADEQRPDTPASWERSGALTSSDDKYEGTGRPFDVWLTALAKGQTLRVEVRSADFVPHFTVIGPLSDADPPVVAESAGSDNGHAHATVSSMRAGNYGIAISSSSAAAYGTYRLSSNYRLSGVWDTDHDIDSVEDVFAMLFTVLLLLQLSGVSVRGFWRYPDRILLLRPFAQGPVSRSLKRITRRHLAYRGFTFTLADKHLKHSLTAYVLAHMPLDLGSLLLLFYRPLFRRMHRYVFVRKPRDLEILRFRLRSRWRLGMFWQSWLGLGDRINKIRSRNELWMDCIDVLFESCQVIVVDVSYAGPGTTWELEQLFRCGYRYKAVFLVVDAPDQVAMAQDLVLDVSARYGVVETEVPTLCRYSNSGATLLDTAAFESAYAAAVSSAQQPAAMTLPTSIKAVLAAAPTAMLGPLWSPVGVVLGLLALRDIRRADGMLRGEAVAHWAVAVHGAILCFLVALAGIALFT